MCLISECHGRPGSDCAVQEKSGMRSLWCGETSISTQQTRTKDRTKERNGDEKTLYGVDPPELFEQVQIEQCIFLSIG